MSRTTAIVLVVLLLLWLGSSRPHQGRSRTMTSWGAWGGGGSCLGKGTPGCEAPPTPA
ncbi:MAG: hypothetical protein ACJ79H_10080 [Myxococcales bacterium]